MLQRPCRGLWYLSWPDCRGRHVFSTWTMSFWWPRLWRAPEVVKRSLSKVPPGRPEAETIKVFPITTQSGIPWLCDLCRRYQYWSCKDRSSSTVASTIEVTNVRSFLALASYYQRFIKNFANIATPLHYLTAKTTEKFKWSPDCDLAFRVLKEKLYMLLCWPSLALIKNL